MRYFLIISLLFGILKFQGQDVHYSQFFHSPVFQNPAQTGMFNGDYRFTFNQRTQWKSVTQPFNTWSISAESKEYPNIENVSSGFVLLKDLAGDSRLSTLKFLPSISYAKTGLIDSSAVLSFGLQLGVVQRKIDYTSLRFNNQFNGSVYDPSWSANEDFSDNNILYLDASIGIGFDHQVNSNMTFNTGLALYHINSPRESFFNDKEVKLDSRLVFHSQGLYVFDEQWAAVPAFQFQSQGTYKELLIGGMAKRIIEDQYGLHRAVYLGAFGRTRDAAYIVAAMDYDQWKVGISYDFNLSDLQPASNSKGGLEIGIIYILSRFKEKYTQHRYCPSFI